MLVTGLLRLADADAQTSSDAGQTPSEGWAFHVQSTLIEQYHPGFAAAYSGPNSLDSGRRGNESFGVMLLGGLRPWPGAQVWINPEVAQGFGLSDSEGVAGFPSAAAYKIGQGAPYIKLQRLFLRQTIDLGGARQSVQPDANRLGGHRTADRLVLTIGKYNVVDIFDTNRYAHDPDNDFLNWTVVDSGAFDYAANAWGYTYGATAEWYRHWWTLRAGLFDGASEPNATALDFPLGRQFQFVAEGEARYHLVGRPGAARLLFFVTHANLAAFSDLNRYLAEHPGAGDDELAALRGPHNKYGAALNLEQALDDGDTGVFLRASLADGRTEAYAYTDVDRSLAIGVSGSGKAWRRDKDKWGLAFVVNEIDHAHKDYFAAGGKGLQVGDGELPDAGPEQIVETWYGVDLPLGLSLTPDYQFVNHPAYSIDRGPVHVFGVRLHAEF